MKNVRANAKFWIAGTLIAFLGVALARNVGPALTGTARMSTVVGGQLLALSGLFLICLGVRRRIKSGESKSDPLSYRTPGASELAACDSSDRHE